MPLGVSGAGGPEAPHRVEARKARSEGIQAGNGIGIANLAATGRPSHKSDVHPPSIWQWLQDHPLAQHIGFTWWFPLLESIHVIGIGLVIGSILTVDLRLLGLAALRYPLTQITGKLLPWTWAAFVVAAITGFGMFVTRAPAYVENPAFQIKFLLLPLACINMAIFHFRTFRRGIADWDTAEEPPPAARIAGGASLLIWAGIVLAGRWTGHLI